MKEVKLETNSVKIHLASKEEMQLIVDMHKDDEYKDAYIEMQNDALNHLNEWEWYAFWIIENKDGEIVGDVSFKGINDGVVEIGYLVLEKHQNKGFATSAVKEIVNWALNQEGINRIEAETDIINIASQKVLNNCGFIPLGIIGEEGPRFYISK